MPIDQYYVEAIKSFQSLQALHTWIWVVYPMLPLKCHQSARDVTGLPSQGLPADSLWGLSLGFGLASR